MILDRINGRVARQNRLEEVSVHSLGLRGGNVGVRWKWWPIRRESQNHPISNGETSSEQELATISVAIAAREISERQNQAHAAATIYPDSSLPSYNQGYQIFLHNIINKSNIHVKMYIFRV